MPGMEKLLRGILRYCGKDRQMMVEQFKKVADHPEPTAVFFTCIDSRVLASRFSNTNVGDMLIVRNAGNMVPSAKYLRYESITTEPGALELGCIVNNIRHVVVCGHSDCKAMNLLYSVKHACCDHSHSPLQIWLKKHGHNSVKKFDGLVAANNYMGPLQFQAETENDNFEAYIDPENKFSMEDKFSQVNTLQQLQHIASYPFLLDKLIRDEVHLHAMWFDIYTGNVYMFSRQRKCFTEITEENFHHLLEDSTSKVSIEPVTELANK